MSQRACSVSWQVWVSYPLKQGLKHQSIHSRSDCYLHVWVSYPLKQGLKHEKIPESLDEAPGLSQLSIKTRIETYIPGWLPSSPASVWVSYPLKQGLKRNQNRPDAVPVDSVWVSYPLKQGLKHKQFIPNDLKAVDSLSQLSIKTRIETSSPSSNFHNRHKVFESAIH